MSGNQLSRGLGFDSWRARRWRARSRLGLLLSILSVVVLGALIWLLWQPYMRISSVTVYGADQSYAHYASDAMRGTYLGIVPRDSVFFYPAHEIRMQILASNQDIAAVSLFREGLTALSIKIINRVPVARWCGSSPSPQAYLAPSGVEGCYLFDASGNIYNIASSSSDTLNAFKLYDTLAASSTEPLGATLTNADALPAAFDFARKLAVLGGMVSAVVIRGDEVDDLIASSTTRVTYVLGDEQAAYAALVSAKGDYNLSDGSLEYLDLRFPAKIYLKKK
jgi:hypothetical protein